MKPGHAFAALALILPLLGCSTIDADIFPVADTDRLASSPCGISHVELKAQINLPADLMVGGSRLGGISGIDYSADMRSWLLVSDAREGDGGTRIFRASMEQAGPDSFDFEVFEGLAVSMAGSDGTIRPLVDAEAIRFIPASQEFYISTEGDKGNGIEPGILRSDASGPVVREIAWRNGPVGDGKTLDSRALRSNLSFEGLSIAPGNDGFWYGLEAPYIGHGDLPTLEHGADVPIVHVGSDGRVRQEFRYPVEPIAAQLPGQLADNGLSELLALDGNRFLVLERSGAQQLDGNFRFTGRLFCAWAADEGEVLYKSPVVELNDLGSYGYANFEGMSFGPMLEDGRRMLAIVSDNNFVPGTPTTLLILAVTQGR